MGVLTFSDLEITVLSKDAAVVLGSWSLAQSQRQAARKIHAQFPKIQGKLADRDGPHKLGPRSDLWDFSATLELETA